MQHRSINQRLKMEILDKKIINKALTVITMLFSDKNPTIYVWKESITLEKTFRINMPLKMRKNIPSEIVARVKRTDELIKKLSEIKTIEEALSLLAWEKFLPEIMKYDFSTGTLQSYLLLKEIEKNKKYSKKIVEIISYEGPFAFDSKDFFIKLNLADKTTSMVSVKNSNLSCENLIKKAKELYYKNPKFYELKNAC